MIVMKGNLGDSKSRVYLKIHEHISTSVICREAKECHIERILKMKSEKDSYSRVVFSSLFEVSFFSIKGRLFV